MALDQAHIDAELLPFLSSESRADTRCIAMQYFLGLTGSDEGKKFISENKKYIIAVAKLLDDKQVSISKEAFLALVNLTVDNEIAHRLLMIEELNLLTNLLRYVINPDSVHADIACSLLSNLSRAEACARLIVDTMLQERQTIGFEKIIFVFCQKGHNKHGCFLHNLGLFVSNITQVDTARHAIMDPHLCVIQRLLPFVEYSESQMRRGGIVGALRNCCFETAYHKWLLGESVDILPRLLLPLAGPEEFDDEDNEKLPPDLQYLEPGKKREDNVDIRKWLVEALTQLCATKFGRKYFQDHNAYVILRELFEWEKDPSNKVAVENIIQVIIADEPERGMENLKEIEIPADIEAKLEKSRVAIEKEVAEETAQLQLEEKEAEQKEAEQKETEQKEAEQKEAEQKEAELKTNSES